MERIVIFSGLFIVVAFCMTRGAEARCQQLGNCCKGTNSSHSCFVENGVNMKGEVGKCFCDESCRLKDDCCSDYNDFCKLQNCQVGEWEEWGRCSRECGEGKIKRIRQITSEPKNGGEKCPNLHETRPCMGRKCHQRRDTVGRAIRETARILPAQFGKWRTNKMYDASRGIRKNLFYHYRRNEIITKPAYYAMYELVSTRRACIKRFFRRWAKNLKKGIQICVECQVTAMSRHLGTRCKGHGVFEKMTRWNAMGVPGCHGMWVMKSEHKPGVCEAGNPESYIFV